MAGGSLNRVTIIGRLGADPEIRMAGSAKVANFRLAVSEQWRDKQSGERKERTEWVSVVVWGDGLVGVVEKYISKGSRLYVEGRLQTRKWQDKDGHDRYSTEVVVQMGGQIIMLDSAKQSRGGDANSYGDSYGDEDEAPSQSYGKRGVGPGDYRGPSEPKRGGYADKMLDEDIPFAPEWR